MKRATPLDHWDVSPHSSNVSREVALANEISDDGLVNERSVKPGNGMSVLECFDQIRGKDDVAKAKTGNKALLKVPA